MTTQPKSKFAQALDLLKEATTEELDVAQRIIDAKKSGRIEYLDELSREGLRAVESGYRYSKAKVEEDPMKSVMLAALIGLFFGMFMARRR